MAHTKFVAEQFSLFDEPVVRNHPRAQKCVSCNGSGTVKHTAWRQFYASPYHIAMEPENFFVRKGFIKRGDPLPPEEVKCSLCNGRGKHE